MDAKTDRPNQTRSAVAAIAALVISTTTMTVSPTAAGGPLDSSVIASGLTASAGSVVSVKVGGPQGVLLGLATMSVTHGVLRAGPIRKGVLRLSSLDGGQVADFDVPPERLKATRVKTGDPVEVHRVAAGWRLTAHGQDLVYVVDESGTGLLTSARR